MVFADVDELASYIQLDDPTSSQLQSLQLLLDLATSAIKNWTRQDLELVEDDEALLAGTWGRDLVLPQRPVVGVSAVKINGRELAEGEFEWNDREILRHGRGLPALDGPACRPGWHWQGPAATITVTYSHGYAELPEDVRTVCLELAKRQFTSPAGVAQETIGSYSVTYGAAAGRTGLSLQQEDKALLRRFRRWWA